MATRIAIALVFPCSIALMASSLAEDPKLVFKNEIQSLLADKCGHCHSQTTRKGELDLSSLEGIQRGGESGDPLIAESLEESRLWQVIEDGEMPPDGEPPLSEQQRQRLHRWLGSAADWSADQWSEETPITQHDVLPILLLRCNTCHGPQRRQGGLDLRSRSSMLRGGDRGPALVPGDADASLMIQRVESEACPPGDQLLKFFVRRPTQAEIGKLRQWIDAGAREYPIKPDIATDEVDLLVTDEDRQHWAFQPPRRPDRALTIDTLIGERLRGAGLSFAPEADRATLIRRAFLDLTGLPPTPAQLDRWRLVEGDHWYPNMIEWLLASPRYGERWGRYWLDLAGYSDSEGGISADPLRPVAWKYRDYVIASFNEDKPYDQFLLEQLAGDELVDFEAAEKISEEIVENLVATGFLRMGIDETGSRTMNFVPERLKVISDAITVVSSSLMGLTMECARCHSHKYDPIPQRDYYRFKAIFQGALDEHDWHSFKTRALDLATASHRRRAAQINPPVDAEIKRLTASNKKLTSEINLALLRHHYPEQSEQDHQATLAALKKADNNRTLPQKILVERLREAELKDTSEQPEQVRQLRQLFARNELRIDRLRRKAVAPTRVRALWDLGRPSPTYMLQRGEHDKPGKLVGPGVPSVLTDGKTPFPIEPPFPDGTAKTGRRLALARWLIEPDHPLTARVMVNRIWYHHFGAGLVRSLDNFGLQGDRPSHPQLLDYLATEFVRRGWSIKAMHRLMMNSRAYRQSSQVTDRQHELDPENRLLSRMSLRRLDAEAIRDSMLLVSGMLNSSMGGLADAVDVDHDGLVSVVPAPEGGWRRSVYLQYRRTEIPTMMDTFDYPQTAPNCLTRNVSTVSPQALMLMNGRQVHVLARAMADQVERMIGSQADPGASEASSRVRRQQIVDAVHRIALGRLPDQHQRELAVAALEQLEGAWNGQPERALETYCHTILNSAAFLYVD